MVGLGANDRQPIVPGFKMKGDTIAGRYRVEKLLGVGSSGFVVAARHVYLRRRVTLKILTSTTNALGNAQRRHLATAHQAAALRGLHIARIVDTGFTEDGTPFVLPGDAYDLQYRVKGSAELYERVVRESQLRD